MQEHGNKAGRNEDREEGNVRCLISIRAQRGARRQREEEPEEEQEAEASPGQGASVCEPAAEGTEREEAREDEEEQGRPPRYQRTRDRDETSPGITSARRRGTKREGGRRMS